MYASDNRLASFIDRYAHAVAYSAYAYTLGTLSSKGRSYISNTCDHFGYFHRTLPPLVPKLETSQVLDSSAPIHIREPIATDGNISLLELLVIDNLVLRHNPKTILEIGTFDGRTTLNLAANSSPETKIYTLDLPAQTPSRPQLRTEAADLPFMPAATGRPKDVIRGERFLQSDCRSKITQLSGDSATFDFAPFYNSVDIVFVDGSHSYEYAVNDTQVALRLLRRGNGLILWHDYGVRWPGVTRALNEFFLGDDKFSGLRHIDQTSLVCLSLGGR
jgi:SAM-dependent methyltransferase